MSKLIWSTTAYNWYDFTGPQAAGEDKVRVT